MLGLQSLLLELKRSQLQLIFDLHLPNPLLLPFVPNRIPLIPDVEDFRLVRYFKIDDGDDIELTRGICQMLFPSPWSDSPSVQKLAVIPVFDMTWMLFDEVENLLQALRPSA